jgi:hypothetical protein
LANREPARHFEQVHSAIDVHLVITDGVGDRWPHARSRGEVDDPVEPHPGARKRTFQAHRVPNIALDELKARVRPRAREVPLLDRAIVERIQIVQSDHVLSVREEPFRDVRTNETCGSGDKNSHDAAR